MPYLVPELREQAVRASNINQRLSAIRKLAREAADIEALPEAIANEIKAVKGGRREGRRTGNWLTREQAQQLVNSPGTNTLKGLRDRAILAMLIGCRLRRQEAAHLTFDHIQQRDGRWIVGVMGKRNKTRSVPMPPRAIVAIDEWPDAAEILDGNIFRPVNKGRRIEGDTITPQAIRDVVVAYGEELGLSVASHHLRRTVARLAHKGGPARSLGIAGAFFP
jgi:integrase